MSDNLKQAVEHVIGGMRTDQQMELGPVVGLALTREAVARLGWASMFYRCESCGYGTDVWLALGVEGPPELHQAGLYLASPFTCRCWACAGTPRSARPTSAPPFPGQMREPLNGTMQHDRSVGRDREFNLALIPDDAAWFALPAQVSRPDEGAHLVIPSAQLVRGRRWFHEGPEGPGL